MPDNAFIKKYSASYLETRIKRYQDVSSTFVGRGKKKIVKILNSLKGDNNLRPFIKTPYNQLQRVCDKRDR